MVRGGCKLQKIGHCMNYLKEIERYLEQNAVLSASWLSNEFQISLRKAIELMQQYRSSVDGIIASYRLCRKSPSGCFHIEIVSELDLDTRKDDGLVNQQLYSIQSTQAEAFKTKVVEASLRQAEELLKNTSHVTGGFLDNSFGTVKITGLDVKAVGERIFSSQNLSINASRIEAESLAALSQPPVKPASTSVRSSGPSENATSIQKPKVNSTSAASTAKPKPVVTSQTVKKIEETNAKAAKRFFAAAESKLKNEPEEMDTSGVGAGHDDEEWDDGAPKRVVQKQAPKPAVAQQGEEMDLSPLDNLKNEPTAAASEMDVDDNVPDSPSPQVHEMEARAQGKKRPKIDILKRGAMDDFIEDAAIEEYKRKQGEQGTEQPKKKKKVLVEKSSFDDRGYMVMEMVWEEVTDDESDCLPTKSAVGNLKPTTSITKENTNNFENKKEEKEVKAKPAAKKEKAAAPGQKSMMSFFKKA